MRRAPTFSLLPLFAASGCTLASSLDDSCGYATSEISVVALALDAGAAIRAEIDFEAGDRASPGPELRLCDTDVLTIDGEAPTVTEHPDRVVYVRTFEPGADRSIEFLLERDGGEQLAIAVELPPAFDVVAPMPDQQVSRSSDFLLQWAPPQVDGQIHIGLAEEIGYGICLRTDVAEHDYKDIDGVVVADDGDWLVPADVVQADDGGACEASYGLTRIRPADYPDALESGGYAEGQVVRSVAFVSVP